MVTRMLKYKHMRLNQEKIERAKKILNAKTETEAMDKALDRVIQNDQDRSQRRKIMKRIIQLRNSLGKMPEDSAEWLRLARQERFSSHDNGP
jgi:cytochrome c-type biogenesis protein CcmH/NrfG